MCHILKISFELNIEILCIKENYGIFEAYFAALLMMLYGKCSYLMSHKLCHITYVSFSFEAGHESNARCQIKIAN